MPTTLDRFVAAQEPVYAQVVAELTAGRKRSHWMWFIFPQIEGLGSSEMARRFALSGLEEARDYLAHPTLGARLRECTALVNAIASKEIGQILGYPDDLKFRSCMTLFAAAAQTGEQAGSQSDSLFAEALSLFFDGAPDAATLERL